MTNSFVAVTPNLAQQYQKKTDKQHILDNPDTYIGSVENVDANMWIYDATNNVDDDSRKISLNHIEYVPGLYKLFDEGVVNCRDHVIRMSKKKESNDGDGHGDDVKCVTYIHISISDDGIITMENDGNGIDIAKHPEYNLWIPEMVFGHLRTSTNYDQTEKRIVGGKNGFGFKLVLIWSLWGRVETVDHTRGLKYEQEFRNNLDHIDTPTITKIKGKVKPFTKVSFLPDYARLGVPVPLPPTILALFRKRVYDISAITDAKIKVSYNGELIPIKNFQQYVELYVGKGTKKVYETTHERWEYCVALSPTQQFEQVSFVNGICTFKGGKHVDYIMGQITRKLSAFIEKKKKISVNPNTIKEQLVLFLRSDIENPAFDSQTKDYMNTPMAKFGSSCVVSDAFIEKVAKMGVMDAACSLTELKERNTAKKTDGSKTRSVRGIANFIDANGAGTAAHSKSCILILCEGLSAMSGVVSGLSSSDRDRFGIYPLKGKLLNVRGEAIKKVSENKEIADLKKILGLETGKQYNTMEDVSKHLRYGKVMMLVDSDLDGSHIKGLCVNLFQSEWGSLFRLSGFLSFMNTPILRAKKHSQTILFYNEGEYNAWCEGNETSGWTIKYFKGLGTSTAAEFKEYFANKKFVDFCYTGDHSDQIIDKIFNKKRADERKTWLEQYDKHSYLNTSNPTVPYEEFINKELIHFSVYDCERSIPNMVDGLKISQRKILYCAFKRRLTSEIKVAQFSGYVSEHSEYHHGEQSLHSTIIGMAQDFVGSNNINLLLPKGQFGSRLNANDAASERYIFTELNPLTRYAFPYSDDAILTYKCEDGHDIEPEFYVPILPFVLCNGISGIGTGFSSSIPPFHPIQIIQYLKSKLAETMEHLSHTFIPYYEGFRGTVASIPDDPNKFIIKGVFEKTSPTTLRIRELPIGTWTMPYIAFLESLVDGGIDKNGKKIAPILKDFVNHSTERIVDIQVTFSKTMEQNDSEIEKALKLTTTVSTTNMHLFDHNCKLVKYNSIKEIIDAFFNVRMETFSKRKERLIQDMELALIKLANKAKYIQYVLDGQIDLRRKTMEEIDSILVSNSFVKLDDSFSYLIHMPMISVAQELVDKLNNEKRDKEKELETLRMTTTNQMWMKELTIFEQEYQKHYLKTVSTDIASSTSTSSKKKK
jgi:DNA topoisomerase-2